MLLLIISLPTENASTRMRAWRALKACGAAMLRDGVYLLPEGEGRRETLASVAEDVNASGGQAWLLTAEEAEETEETGHDFAPLFDRTADYLRLAADLEAVARDAETTAAPDLARLLRKLRKGLEGVKAIDFYPGEARRQVEAQWAELERLLATKTRGDEPGPRAALVRRQDLAAYQGRLWATRRRPWVDRLASAWLIRRHIDPQARFLWLAAPGDCPPEALGFDFDGAAFTHTPDFVSFETLLHSFGLETDAALMWLARLVHFLDVGGLPQPEAPGLEAVLAGMRAAIAEDDALLAAASQTFDYLYVNFGVESHD